MSSAEASRTHSEIPFWFLLLTYAASSFSYNLIAGLLGKQGSALGTYQTYAMCMPAWFALFALVHRWRRVRKGATPPRYWPPTKSEGLAAVGAVLQLSAETLSLLQPASLVAILAAKAGCQVLPDPQRKSRKPPLLAVAAIVAVLLASLGKPLTLLLPPIGLACIYLLGIHLKLKGSEIAKDNAEARPGFLAAGQVVVCSLTLSVSSGFAHFETPARLSLAIVILAGLSLTCGLLGTVIVTHSTPRAVGFPAYRAASLLCSLGASRARGEQIGWSGWAAVALALTVVFVGSGGGLLLKRWVQSWSLALSVRAFVYLQTPKLAPTPLRG